jgi:hypothetical protein
MPRYDTFSRARTATPQELRTEIASLEAKDAQRKRDIEECTRRIDVYDPVCRHRLRREQLIKERAADAVQLHNLRYELKCSRSRDDWGDPSNNDGDGEWRPAPSTYTYGDNG